MIISANLRRRWGMEIKQAGLALLLAVWLGWRVSWARIRSTGTSRINLEIVHIIIIRKVKIRCLKLKHLIYSPQDQWPAILKTSLKLDSKALAATSAARLKFHLFQPTTSSRTRSTWKNLLTMINLTFLKLRTVIRSS